jgi:ABC-2 family transporter
MLLQILTIARNTFIESMRQPILFVLVMLAGVFQLLGTWSTGYAMGYTESGEVSGDNKLMFDIGLGTVFVLGMLLAAFLATAVVSREIENKTVLTVVSKPVGRPSVILGKFTGVAGAILIAVITMLLFLLMGLRHEVMSTAADDLDGPVILFTGLALAVAMGTALWCNFFYGWYFSQTCIVILMPAMLVAYIAVLAVSKKWHLQPLGTDFKDQVSFACIALTLAILVLTAIATAVSTRLGQVMTIVVCSGVFLFGLLSNYFIGRHAFHNKHVAVIAQATPDNPDEPGWGSPGAGYAFTLKNPPTSPVRPGDSFYYSTSPSGFPMDVPASQPFKGDPQHDSDILGAQTPPGLVVISASGSKLRVRKVGAEPLRTSRPPESEDFVFLKPTEVNYPAMTLWAAIPNMHYFWMVDAISQNQIIPPRHMVLVGLYAAGQIAAFLALGVVLFQKRDVG